MESSTCSQYQHIKFKELKGFGLSNETQLKTTFIVYLDLCEAKGWWNVEVHPCHSLNLAFISGHPTRGEKREIVLPMLCSEVVTHEEIQQYLQEIKLEGYHTEGITFAICDTDSTTVYYKIMNGLVSPEAPEISEVKKQHKFDMYRKRMLNVQNAVETYEKSKQDKHTKENKLGETTEEIT